MNSDGSWLNGNARSVGVAIGAAIAVAVGGYTGWKALEPSAYHAEAPSSDASAIADLRRDLFALAARTTNLETAGAVTRERFEAFERLALERLERMKRAEERMEQILDRLRALEAVVSQTQDRVRDLERRKP